METPEIKIEPEDEVQQRTTGGTIALRIGAALLGAFIGFSFFIGAYVSILLIDSTLLGPGDYILARLWISVILWALLGLFTPFHIIGQAFGAIFSFIQGSSGKVISYARLVIFFVIIMVISFIYWHIIGFLAPIIDTIFSE